MKSKSIGENCKYLLGDLSQCITVISVSVYHSKSVKHLVWNKIKVMLHANNNKVYNIQNPNPK